MRNAVIFSAVATASAWTEVASVRDSTPFYIGNDELDDKQIYEAQMCLINDDGLENCVDLTDADAINLPASVNIGMDTPLKRLIATLAFEDYHMVPQWYCPDWDGEVGECDTPTGGLLVPKQLGVPCTGSNCWTCAPNPTGNQGMIVKTADNSWHVWGWGITLTMEEDGTASLDNPDYGDCEPDWTSFVIRVLDTWLPIFEAPNGQLPLYAGNDVLDSLSYIAAASMCIENDDGLENCVDLTDADAINLPASVNIGMDTPLKRLIATLAFEDYHMVPQWYCPDWDGEVGECDTPTGGLLVPKQLGVPCTGSNCWTCAPNPTGNQGMIVKTADNSWHVWGWGITLTMEEDGTASLDNPDYGDCEPLGCT